jgi:Ni,Fe-hydrogenase III large subunit
VTPELAARLGVAGLAARASGRAQDLRRDFPSPPYDTLEVAVPTSAEGDVAARVGVRFDELAVSLRLCESLLAALPEGPVTIACHAPQPYALGLGYVEGWRGPVLVALECDPDGTIRRCHPHDVSWHNWPALEHAVIGNIVPDFPLINKSFNLTYSGHDL